MSEGGPGGPGQRWARHVVPVRVGLRWRGVACRPGRARPWRGQIRQVGRARIGGARVGLACRDGQGAAWCGRARLGLSAGGVTGAGEVRQVDGARQAHGEGRRLGVTWHGAASRAGLASGLRQSHWQGSVWASAWQVEAAWAELGTAWLGQSAGRVSVRARVVRASRLGRGAAGAGLAGRYGPGEARHVGVTWRGLRTARNEQGWSDGSGERGRGVTGREGQAGPGLTGRLAPDGARASAWRVAAARLGLA